MAGCSLWIACLLFLLVGPIAPVLCGGAQADVLATWEDPAGDDTGDGDYSYPSGRAFGDGGQADLLGFTIERDNGNLIFEFRLRRVVDPTEARSVPAMVAVAIDTQEGGDTELRHNANVHLEHPSEYQIFAAGVSAEVINDASELVEAGASVVTDTAAGTIRVSVPMTAINGAASNWRFTPAVGLRDDYGAGRVGDFREVMTVVGEWRGGGGDDLAIDPNVYDVIVPEPRKFLGLFGGDQRTQEEILGAYDLARGECAVLPALEMD